jgi:hypothetical protein
MELYGLKHRPQTFDLKVNLPGVGRWDVAAVFNWDRKWSKHGELRTSDLGIAPGRCGFAFFDVWRERLLCAGCNSVRLSVPPMGCRLVAIHRAESNPQVLATSRHVSAGAADLREVCWNARGGELTGVSDAVADEPYRIHFSVPAGWRVRDAGVSVRCGWGTLALRPDKAGPVPWRVRFEQPGRTSGRR